MASREHVLIITRVYGSSTRGIESTESGFHLGFSSKGGGGQTRQLRSSRKARTISVFYPQRIIIIVFIKYLTCTLGGSAGMLPKEKFSTLQPLRPFLVASEHAVGEKPVISSSWFPSFLIVKCWMGDVPSPARSAKL